MCESCEKAETKTKISNEEWCNYEKCSYDENFDYETNNMNNREFNNSTAYNDLTKLPVKPGYKRKYASCGAYCDRPIINRKAGEERCNGCDHPFQINALHTDGANSHLKYVCTNCLKNGKVLRCDICKGFVGGMVFRFSKGTKRGTFR